jgi:hypothetical protein
MNIFSLIITIIGLALFEVVSSIDNAVINAEVLSTMRPRARRWFLFWGLLFAVFVIRGVLPWIIVWFTSPPLDPLGALTATFSNDPNISSSINASAPVLLIGGGIFLILLFLHWLFLEDKRFGLPHERFLAGRGIMFYIVSSLFLILLVCMAFRESILVAVGGMVGAVVFFITHGLKQMAEQAEESLVKGSRSDVGKIIYLEIIDAAFSIDGVLGAFAFTLSVPLIIIGNGMGAFIVRQLTVGNIERIKRYVYLKNGAMYSIFFLGCVMCLDAFHVAVPGWVSPLVTFLTIGYFFEKSRRRL